MLNIGVFWMKQSNDKEIILIYTQMKKIVFGNK